MILTVFLYNNVCFTIVITRMKLLRFFQLSRMKISNKKCINVMIRSCDRMSVTNASMCKLVLYTKPGPNVLKLSSAFYACRLRNLQFSW